MSDVAMKRVAATPDAGAWRLAVSPSMVKIALATCAAFYLGGVFALTVRFSPAGISLFWPPNAILLATLLLTPPRTWWFYVLAVVPTQLHLVTTFQPDVPTLTKLCQLLGNVGQAVLAALALRRAVGSPPRFDSLRGMAAFIILAAIAAPAVASAVVSYLFVLTGWAADFGLTWRRRFLTNVIPTLTIVPLIVLAVQTGLARMIRDTLPRRYLECGLLVTSLVAIGLTVFALRREHLPIGAELYAPLPVLLWAAVRFGTFGTCLSILLVSAVCLVTAFVGQGPFLTGSAAEAVLSLQVFLTAIAVPLMLLAALTEERKQTARALRRNQERLELAQDAGGVAAFDWFPTRHESVWSKELEALYGLSPGSYDGRYQTWLSCVHPEDRRHAHEEMQRTLTKGTQDFEFRVVWPDRSVHWLHARGRAYHEAGEPARIVGVNVDVTDRKRAEEALHKARSDLARLGRVTAMGELSTAIAHEVNQPLTAIMANAKASLAWLSRGRVEPDELRAVLTDIAADAARAGDVIQRTRRMFVAGQGERVPLNLNDIVREVVGMVRPSLDREFVNLRTELTDAHGVVRGDRVQIQQVLLNLVTNAVEAMSEVHGRARTLVIRTSRDEAGRMAVAVSDSGVGVEPKDVERLFVPFHTTKSYGMGVGLSISRSIIEAHGGRLRARANDGPGATFEFVLPNGEAALDQDLPASLVRARRDGSPSSPVM
jgi:two-component system, LuxR family, sensor kinase FixL